MMVRMVGSKARAAEAMVRVAGAMWMVRMWMLQPGKVARAMWMVRVQMAQQVPGSWAARLQAVRLAESRWDWVQARCSVQSLR